MTEGLNHFTNIKLPASLHGERQERVAILRLARPEKRNALNDETIIGIETFFTSLPDDISAVLLHGEGEHFSAGLDLGELKERDVSQGIEHSRLWHRAFEKIQFGKVPVVAVLHGAVVGGGLDWQPPHMSGSQNDRPTTRCPRAAAASMSAAAARCGCRA